MSKNNNSQTKADTTSEYIPRSVSLSTNPLVSAQYPKHLLLADLFLAIDATKIMNQEKHRLAGILPDGKREVSIEWQGGILTFIGPPLTTQHEDVLIGLIQLLAENVPSKRVGRERIAEYEKLPAIERRKQLDFFDPIGVPIDDLVPIQKEQKISATKVALLNSHGEAQDAEFAEVMEPTKLRGSLTIGQLLFYLNKNDGALAYKEHASALEDLFETKVVYKTENNYPVEQRLLELKGERLSAASKGRKQYKFTYEFKGLMRALLAEYAVIDFSVRPKLNPNGKLFHRQLAHHGFPTYKYEFPILETDLKRMMNKDYWSHAINPLKSKGNKPGQLDILQSEGFFKGYEFIMHKEKYGEKALIINPGAKPNSD
ncbi:hypothetical protein [Reinekea sp. G2M2-21]|uniref:hypothetical protein n=1 Tax=Reinekea sp. G2M2-21 TaxID=2788942 RepID=UPI0018AA3C4B|nr:hypothetical protein [Reinekea sp. G2M2-21]